jgi:Ankyrin repeats (3 copies)
MRKAIIDGDLERVKHLLKNDSLCWNPLGLACDYGRLEIFKLLLARFNPSDYCNYAIRTASRNGFLEIVKLLLMDNRVDPGVGYNECIKTACVHGRWQVVEILLDDKRVVKCDGFSYWSNINRIIREKIKKNTEIVVILKKFNWLPDDLIPLIMDFVCIKYRKY